MVFRLAGDVLSVSRDGGQTWVNGYDPTTGTLLVNVLDAIGINADWIKAGQIEAARMATNVITAINAPKSGEGVYLTFDSRCATESTSYDYLRFYYVEDNVVYASERYGGQSGDYALAGKTLYIPRNEFYVQWHSDNIVQDWGIKVTDGGVGRQGTEVQFPIVSSLPSITVTDIANNVNMIETAHPYVENDDKLWKVSFADSTVTINADRVNINGTVTLTDYTNGLLNGSTQISGGCIRSGTIQGVNLISETSGAGKLNIHDGQIDAYYDNVFFGTIQIASDASRNQIKFHFGNDERSRFFINAGNRIELQIRGSEKFRIESDSVEFDGVDVTLYGQKTLTSYRINADDHFRCDGFDGYTGTISVGSYYISVHGGIITSIY